MCSPSADRATGRILCIGGATVDRTYRLAATLIPGTSNPAARTLGLGGVARNVAENLGRRGRPVGLLTRVGDDEAGRALTAGLDGAGVDRAGVVAETGAATAEYVAVLTPGGELALGLAAMAIFDGLTPEALDAAADLLASAAWVFADCNLPAESLLALARRRWPGDFRLAIDAVSVAKAARLPDDLAGVDLLFLNRDEAGAVAAARGLPGCSPRDAALAALGGGAAAVVVTLGAEGALAAGPAGVAHVPAVPARVVDVTGAGDALVAAVLMALCSGADLVEAVARGCAAASRTVATPSSVVQCDLSA